MGYLRLRILQNKKRSTHVAKRAKNPKTEMTTIAQWGKDEVSLPLCTLPVGLVVDELEFDKPVEPAAEGDGDGDDVEDMVERTESA